MEKVTFKQLTLILALLSVNVAYSQNKTNFDFDRIEDNSFFIEEAYNQDPGVIQHISTFEYLNDKTWAYSLTDEWPLAGIKHQISANLPLMHMDFTGIGDIALNYRYQAIYADRLAFSPRLSLLFPTGNYKKGLGNGVIGYQLNLPLSFICSRKLVTHYNLGATLTPGAKGADGSKSDINSINYGASAILLISPTFNFMLEVAGNRTSVKAPNVKTTTGNSIFINPGVRYAINFQSGLQIVPGLAVPIGLDSSKDKIGIFAYLSFEHPLKH